MRFNMGTQTKVIAIITTGMTRAMRLSDINLSPYDSQQERRLEGRNSLRGKQNSLRRTTSDDAVGLRPLFALNDLEGYLVAFLEALVSVFLNGAEMDEHIFAAIVAEKAVALYVVKPLHGSFKLTH
jgi:hypothetical protein